MNKPLRRRGRPPRQMPASAGNTVLASSENQQEPEKTQKRRRRASVGGFHLKLTVPQRDGYMRRWFNDVPGRIANAEELAYTHVTDPGIKSDSPDSRVRRLVGTQANGQPLYAYLMETPIEEYRAGQAEREELHRQVDQDIRDGRDATGRIDNPYGEGSIRA